MNVDDDLLIAFADGELDEVTRQRVANAVAHDPALRARLEAHRKLRETVAAHYAPIAQKEVPDRFRAMLAGGPSSGGEARPVAGDVVSLAEARAKRAVRRKAGAGWRIGWGNAAAIAATLVLGVLVGRGLGGGTGPVRIVGGQMVASSGLATALNGQLASAQAGDGAVRIGLTFKTKDGDYCRSFEGRALSGIACHNGESWRVEQAVSGRQEQGAYRQASSGDPRIMTNIETMIEGAPLDAAGEKAARDRGWK